MKNQEKFYRAKFVITGLVALAFSAQTVNADCDESKVATLKNKAAETAAICKKDSESVDSASLKAQTADAKYRLKLNDAQIKYGKKCISGLSASRPSSKSCKKSSVKNATKAVKAIASLKKQLSSLKSSIKSVNSKAAKSCDVYDKAKKVASDYSYQCPTIDDARFTPTLPEILESSPLQPRNFFPAPTETEAEAGFPIEYLAGRWYYIDGSSLAIGENDPIGNPNFNDQAGTIVDLQLGTNGVYRLVNWSIFTTYGVQAIFRVREVGVFSADANSLTLTPAAWEEEFRSSKGGSESKFSRNRPTRVLATSTTLLEPLSNILPGNNKHYNVGLKLETPCKGQASTECYTPAVINETGDWKLQRIENSGPPK